MDILKDMDVKNILESGIEYCHAKNRYCGFALESKIIHETLCSKYDLKYVQNAPCRKRRQSGNYKGSLKFPEA